MHFPEEQLGDPDRQGGRPVKGTAVSVRGWKNATYILVYYPRTPELRGVPMTFNVHQGLPGIRWLDDEDAVTIGNDIFVQDAEKRNPISELTFRLLRSERR